MKRPFHPLLFAAFPVLSVYSTNLGVVPPSDLLRPLGVSILLGACIWLLCWAVWRDGARSASAASVLILSMLAFAPMVKWMEPLVIVKSWAPWVVGVLFLSVSAVSSWKLKSIEIPNLLSIAVVGVTLASIAFGSTRTKLLVVQQASSGAETFHGAKPDVYWVMLDGYGRSDALRRALGYDNGWFVKELERRGFVVQQDSVSNYSQTELSAASTLNMEPLDTILPAGAKADNVDRTVFAKLIDDSAAMRAFKDLGYATFSVTTGFPHVQFAGADVRASRANGFSVFEASLLQLTPLALEEKLVGSMFETRRNTILRAFDALERLAPQGARPKLVLAHFLAPHPPFVFRSDGSPAPATPPYGIWDGSDYLHHVGTRATYAQGYSDQVEYLNKRLIQWLDVLLKTDGPRPIVILQGDHGSKAGLDQNSLEKTDLNECFPILSAVFAPEEVARAVAGRPTPVNTFRSVLRAGFGQNLPHLPDRSWYSTYVRPLQLTEVTERLQRSGSSPRPGSMGD